MTKKRKDCWACEKGHYKSPYTGSHGFQIPGVGMVDTSCPISEADYDGIASMGREVRDEMKQEVK